jgi:hypothetical protein
MRASISQVASAVRNARAELSIRIQRTMLNRLFLIGAIVSIVLAHGIVLYKIDAGARSSDTGVRSSDVTPVMASRARRAFW